MAVRRTSIVVVRSTRIVAGIKAVVAVRGLFAELIRADEDILHYYLLVKTQQKWAKSGPVVVGVAEVLVVNGSHNSNSCRLLRAVNTQNQASKVLIETFSSILSNNQTKVL